MIQALAAVLAHGMMILVAHAVLAGHLAVIAAVVHHGIVDHLIQGLVLALGIDRREDMFLLQFIFGIGLLCVILASGYIGYRIGKRKGD